MKTLKFISTEHPLKFYGIPGLFFLGIGLFFTIWTLQIFTETREIMINVALIGIGCLIFGVMLMMSAIILFTVVTIIREK